MINAGKRVARENLYCENANQYGVYLTAELSYYFFLSFPGPPSGPYIITNTVTWLNSTSFTLKWTRPPHDGGDPNFRYDVEYSKETPDGKYVHWNTRKNIEAQEYNVTGLESGSKYEFRVFVSNIAGRKREPARKEFNVYSGIGITPTPLTPGNV